MIKTLNKKIDKVISVFLKGFFLIPIILLTGSFIYWDFSSWIEIDLFGLIRVSIVTGIIGLSIYYVLGGFEE